MRIRLTYVPLLAASLLFAACDEDDSSPMGPVPEEVPVETAVFTDAYTEGVSFQPFAGSKADAVSIDPAEAYRGEASLRITIPAAGDPSGEWAGGAFVASTDWDLSQYDALSFWVRADRNATLDNVGLGNDNSGNAEFEVSRGALEVSSVWRKVVIPIPDPSLIDPQAGLFHFGEGNENGAGYTIWLDDIRFEKMGASLVRASMANQTLVVEVGGSAGVKDLAATMRAGQVDIVVTPSYGYFDFRSSDESVATVTEQGQIAVVGSGEAVIEATLGSNDVSGAVRIATGRPLSEPAPTPPHPASDVISLFSGAYDNHPVDTWSASWDGADLEAATIQGDLMWLYTNLIFAGIEFTSQPVDATEMTHFHMDIWTPDGKDGEVFKIKLVDFGADGSFDGGDDVEHEISVRAPTLASQQWVSIDVPLSDFANMTTRASVAQLIISGDPNTVYVDNVYFHRGGGSAPPTEPSSAAPAPGYAEANVVSLFSGPYTDGVVDTWSAGWDDADVEDVEIAGDAVKKYTNLTFAGIEFTSATVDATEMTHFRMDVWTPDAIDTESAFNVKLVDFGADGAWSGGDDVEHEVTVTSSSTPSIASGQWSTLEIPLSAFENMTTRGAVAQMIISGTPNTVFVDNVLFYRDVSIPTAAPADPEHPADDVISLFSDSYTDVTVDTWSASWDVAEVEDIDLGGNIVKKYSGVAYAGIEFTSAPIDATAMTHFRMDVWTPEATDDGQVFKIKLVDFGADGAFDGGDDVEHEISLDASQGLTTGSWISFDIPLSDFANLTTQGSLAQMIISGLGTVVIDNVYLRK